MGIPSASGEHDVLVGGAIYLIKGNASHKPVMS